MFPVIFPVKKSKYVFSFSIKLQNKKKMFKWKFEQTFKQKKRISRIWESRSPKFWFYYIERKIKMSLNVLFCIYIYIYIYIVFRKYAMPSAALSQIDLESVLLSLRHSKLPIIYGIRLLENFADNLQNSW